MTRKHGDQGAGGVAEQETEPDGERGAGREHEREGAEHVEAGVPGQAEARCGGEGRERGPDAQQHTEARGDAHRDDRAGGEQRSAPGRPLQGRHDPAGGVVGRHRRERQGEERELRGHGGEGRDRPGRVAPGTTPVRRPPRSRRWCRCRPSPRPRPPGIPTWSGPSTAASTRRRRYGRTPGPRDVVGRGPARAGRCRCHVAASASRAGSARRPWNSTLAPVSSR